MITTNKTKIIFILFLGLLHLNAYAQLDIMGIFGGGSDKDKDNDQVTVQQAEQREKKIQANRDALVQKADSVVRQERINDPNAGKPNISLESATGSMTPVGVEKDLENLTDAEKVLSENYVHDGLANRIIKEECDGEENNILCQGQDPSQRGMLIQALAKAYTMVVGMAGGSMKAHEGGGGAEGGASGGGAEGGGAEGGGGGEGSADNGGNQGGDEKGEVNDYCRFIAVGTEVFAAFQQQAAQNKLTALPTSADTKQRDLLLKAAISHEERSKQAQTQTVGWGATAGCYWAMLAVAQLDFQLALKIGGSTLLAGFFYTEINRHKEYAEKIRTIADKLPGVGDCNPITERLCYCAQPETMNDPVHCSNEMRQRHLNANAFMTLTCLDDKMKADPSCRCVDTESCFDKKLENDLRGIGFGNLEMQGIRPIQEMSRGSLSAGSVNNMNRNIGALNNRLDRNPEIKKLADRALNKQQAETFEGLKAAGISPTLSRLMALQPPLSGAQQNLARFDGGALTPDLKTAFSARPAAQRNNNLYFRGGQGLADNKPTRNQKTTPDFLKKLRQGQKGDEQRGPSNVLTFADRAERSAQITRSKDTPIFEIISHRYRQSAWKRLPMDIEE